MRVKIGNRRVNEGMDRMTRAMQKAGRKGNWIVARGRSAQEVGLYERVRVADGSAVRWQIEALTTAFGTI